MRIFKVSKAVLPSANLCNVVQPTIAPLKGNLKPLQIIRVNWWYYRGNVYDVWPYQSMHRQPRQVIRGTVPTKTILRHELYNITWYWAWSHTCNDIRHDITAQNEGTMWDTQYRWRKVEDAHTRSWCPPASVLTKITTKLCSQHWQDDKCGITPDIMSNMISHFISLWHGHLYDITYDSCNTLPPPPLPSWLKAKAVSRPIWSGRHGFNSCHPQHEACFVISTKQYACLYWDFNKANCLQHLAYFCATPIW